MSGGRTAAVVGRALTTGPAAIVLLLGRVGRVAAILRGLTVSLVRGVRAVLRGAAVRGVALLLRLLSVRGGTAVWEMRLLVLWRMELAGGWQRCR